MIAFFFLLFVTSMVSFLNTCSPILCLAIWFQNSSLYHFSMFHASHHITPIPASNIEASFLLNLLLCCFKPFFIPFWQIFCLADWSWSSCCEVCDRAYVSFENSSRQGYSNFNRCSSRMLAGHYLLTYGDVTLASLDRSSA